MFGYYDELMKDNSAYYNKMIKFLQMGNYYCDDSRLLAKVYNNYCFNYTPVGFWRNAFVLKKYNIDKDEFTYDEVEQGFMIKINNEIPEFRERVESKVLAFKNFDFFVNNNHECCLGMVYADKDLNWWIDSIFEPYEFIIEDIQFNTVDDLLMLRIKNNIWIIDLMDKKELYELLCWFFILTNWKYVTDYLISLNLL